MRLGTALKGAAVLAVALAIALIAAAKSIDFNRYKAFLAEQVKAATGRELTIAGPLVLKPGPVPLLVAQGVTLANAPGGSRAEMIRIDRVEAEIALLPLLKREIRIQRLVLSAPDILLETDSQGRGNWVLGATAKPQASAENVPPTRFALRELKIKNARVAWRDGVHGTGNSLNLHKLTILPEPGAAGLLTVQMLGDYLGREFTGAGKVGGMAALQGGKPWPVQLRAAYHGSSLTVEGSLADPLAGAGADLKVAAQSDELAELARLAGRTMPPVGPFKLTGRLSDGGGRWALADIDADFGRKDAALVSLKGAVKDVAHGAGLDLVAQVESDNLAGLSRLAGTELPSMGPIRLSGALKGGGTTWSLADAKVTLAGSDLAGDATLDLGGRPRLTAKLQSGVLAVADLTTPAVKPGEKLEAKPAMARPGADARLFPADPLSVEALRAFDAQVSLHVAKLIAGPWPLTDLTAAIHLKNGRLALAPAHALLAGGVLDGEAVLDASGRPALDLKLTARNIEAGRLLKDAGADLLTGGHGDLRLVLRGAGASPRDIMAASSGEAVLTIGEGRLNNRTVDWAGGDLLFQILGAVNPLAGRDDTTQLACAVANFQIRDGIATADRGIAIETAKVDVVGAGTVDLRAEALDLGFTPQAREGLGLSVGGSLAGMTRLRGTLAHPVLGVDELGAVKAAASAGAAVATGGLSLLGELLFNKATADANPCRTALAGRAPPPKAKKAR